MKKKDHFSNFLVIAVFSLFIYTVFTYQDTDTFQSIMKFLFDPGAEYTLPSYWQNNRMLLLGAFIFMLILYTIPTFRTFKKAIQLYKNSSGTETKPAVPVLQACYFYQQDKVSCMTTWLVDMCSKGMISLQYNISVDPSERWAVHKEKDHNIDYKDKEVIDILFRENNTVKMKAFIHDPDPNIERSAGDLYESVKEKYRLFFIEKQSTLPIWIGLFLLIAELPFYMASTGEDIPMTLPITLFATAIFTLPVFAFSKYSQAFFNGPKIVAISVFIFSLLFFFIGLWMLYTDRNDLFYWTTALYPSIAAGLLVLIYQAPLLQRDNRLLSQIIGYKKYLAADNYKIREEDLPWVIALDVHSDIFDHSFQYENTHIPEWLQNNTKEENQVVMKALLHTFPAAVNEAVNGNKDDMNSINNDMDHIGREM